MPYILVPQNKTLMNVRLNPLLTLVVVLLSLALVSGTGMENKYADYSAVYNDNEYIVLKRNEEGVSKVFAPSPEHGKLIKDSVAEAEIKLYREKYPTATRSIDFNFNNMIGYIATFQNVENAEANRSLGVRIYPALDLVTKQLTVIISPTRYDRALWKNKNLLNGREAVDILAFNTGSLCPQNCPDGDTTVIAR
jgi:hypothetical protein